MAHPIIQLLELLMALLVIVAPPVVAALLLDGPILRIGDPFQGQAVRAVRAVANGCCVILAANGASLVSKSTSNLWLPETQNGGKNDPFLWYYNRLSSVYFWSKTWINAQANVDYGTGTYAFYELAPQENTKLISNLPVQPGDHMMVTVTYDSRAKTGEFYICTPHNGGSTKQAIEGNSMGIQAEWIAERSYSVDRREWDALMPFPTIKMNASGTEVRLSGGLSDGFRLGQPGRDDTYVQRTNMYGCDNRTMLASPGAIASPGRFDIAFHTSGVQEHC